jgi:hypothetical protein
VVEVHGNFLVGRRSDGNKLYWNVTLRVKLSTPGQFTLVLLPLLESRGL